MRCTGVVGQSLSHKIHRYRSLSELEQIHPNILGSAPLPPLRKAEISILIPPPHLFQRNSSNLVACLQVQTF